MIDSQFEIQQKLSSYIQYVQNINAYIIGLIENLIPCRSPNVLWGKFKDACTTTAVTLFMVKIWISKVFLNMCLCVIQRRMLSSQVNFICARGIWLIIKWSLEIETLRLVRDKPAESDELVLLFLTYGKMFLIFVLTYSYSSEYFILL